jgi:hypothetical protein
MKDNSCLGQALGIGAFLVITSWFGLNYSDRFDGEATAGKIPASASNDQQPRRANEPTNLDSLAREIAAKLNPEARRREEIARREAENRKWMEEREKRRREDGMKFRLKLGMWVITIVIGGSIGLGLLGAIGAFFSRGRSN